jgi:hypothetical protein
MKQKMDFLRTKISPEDLEEVVKRYNADSKEPAPQSAASPQPLAAVMVQAPAAQDSSWRSYAAVGAIGAAILGVAGTTLYMVTSKQNSQKEPRRTKKKPPPPSRDSYSDYHDRDNVPSRDLPHPTLHALVKQQEKTEETVTRLAQQVEALVNVLRPKAPVDELPVVPQVIIEEESKSSEVSPTEALQSFLSVPLSEADKSQTIKSLKV